MTKKWIDYLLGFYWCCETIPKGRTGKFWLQLVIQPKTSFLPQMDLTSNPAANCNAYHNHNAKDFQSRHFPQLSLGACFKWLKFNAVKKFLHYVNINLFCKRFISCCSPEEQLVTIFFMIIFLKLKDNKTIQCSFFLFQLKSSQLIHIFFS